VESLRATGATWTFYEPGHDLGPDPAELDRLLGPDVRALHLTHHLGFPQDSARWRRWCDSRGLLLVEDAAQAWLATRDGVPVGSCLVPLARRHAAWLAQRVPVVCREARNAAYDPIRDFETGTPSGPARATQWLLPRVVSADACAVRRRNFQAYLDAVGHLVPAPFDVLPEGAAPFAFPVAVLDKASALGALRAEGISALDFWAVPHPSLPAARFPRAAWLRRHLVALPVHQELMPHALRRVVAAAREVLADAGTPAPSG
jgi:dTDP-4-amino-4,6-dideoxygalactose transaminase